MESKEWANMKRVKAISEIKFNINTLLENINISKESKERLRYIQSWTNWLHDNS